MEQQQTSPQPPATLPASNPAPHPGPALKGVRHDGWTGDKMANFCEVLAETAVVAEACDATNMSVAGAYAARRRNPVFAAAWDAGRRFEFIQQTASAVMRKKPTPDFQRPL
jgi:hypothetical protein